MKPTAISASTARKPAHVDAHGAWWDATGDFGKHLSHLSFSTYFNPQQIPLVTYSFFKSAELLTARNVPDMIRYQNRMQDEAMYGADYLVRSESSQWLILPFRFDRRSEASSRAAQGGR